MPKNTLSFDRSMVTEVTSPTGIANCHCGAVVSRHTTS
jgi:hypothetical protein